MKRLLPLAILVFVMAAAAHAQAVESTEVIEATTESGRIVLLNPDGTWEFKQKTAVKALGVTLAGFRALKEGMTYDEAAAILGRDGEIISESTIVDVKTVMYQWNARKGSQLGPNMHAMFQNGKLVSKAQAGLK